MSGLRADEQKNLHHITRKTIIVRFSEVLTVQTPKF